MEQFKEGHIAQQDALEPSRGSGVSSFLLKMIAIVSMTLNHTSIIFHDYLPQELNCVLIACGGLAFPIMAFLIGEGYRHTRDVRKYALNLFIFAILSQVPFSLFLSGQVYQGNVLFTLLLGLLVLCLNDRVKNRVYFWLMFVGVVLLSFFLDWGVVGPIMVYLYATQTSKFNKFVLPVIIPILGMGVPQLVALFSLGIYEALGNLLYLLVGCGLTIPLLIAYKGKRGPSAKYLFYAYYPAHILMLGLVRELMLRV